MRIIIFLLAIVTLLSGCTIQQNRTDAEMLAAATEVCQDYFFEYGIDSSLFSSPVVETRPNGGRSYKWITNDSGGIPIGIEVVVTQRKDTKPEMILIGDTNSWLPFVGSKKRK